MTQAVRRPLILDDGRILQVPMVFFPMLTTAQQDAINASAGMVIYNTTTNKLRVYTTLWVDLH